MNPFTPVDGKPAAGMGISLATGANALDTADAVVLLVPDWLW